MNDSEFRKEFILVEKTKLGVQILVCKIEWNGPHTPTSKWMVAKKLPKGATEVTIESAIVSILGDSRFFQVCAECDERNPVDLMHDERICQGCAEANHGAVY